jgi:hypothetical protein
MVQLFEDYNKSITSLQNSNSVEQLNNLDKKLSAELLKNKNSYDEAIKTAEDNAKKQKEINPAEASEIDKKLSLLKSELLLQNQIADAKARQSASERNQKQLEDNKIRISKPIC